MHTKALPLDSVLSSHTPHTLECRQLQQAEPRQLTARAVLVGLGVGSILCFSNTYFGLQTGWVTMGSLQSAILGFGIFKLLERFDCMKGFTVEENVIVQTTSVATATMPLAAGACANFTKPCLTASAITISDTCCTTPMVQTCKIDCTACICTALTLQCLLSFAPNEWKSDCRCSCTKCNAHMGHTCIWQASPSSAELLACSPTADWLPCKCSNSAQESPVMLPRATVAHAASNSLHGIAL